MSQDNMKVDNSQTKEYCEPEFVRPTDPKDHALWRQINAELCKIAREKLKDYPHITVLNRYDPKLPSSLTRCRSLPGTMSFFDDERIDRQTIQGLLDIVIYWPTTGQKWGYPTIDYKDIVYVLPVFEMKILTENNAKYGDYYTMWWYNKPQDLSELVQKQLVIEDSVEQ